MNEALTMLVPGGVLYVPREVAVCPYCDADLIAQPTAWEQQKDGTWAASESGIECTAEPELDEDIPQTLQPWEDWLAEHSVMPYVYMLPVDLKVVAWMKKHFRWDCDKE